MKILTISRRGGLTLALLAAFYFVVGAYVLHPHYHDHDHGEHEHDVVQTVFVLDNSAADELDAADEQHRLCPICDYLTLCSATQPGGTKTTVQSPVSLKAATAYVERILVPVYPRSYIRGPPSLSS